MKLLSERKQLCEAGKLKMCTAEYEGSWLPYKEPFEKVTDEWLLEEMTYDDCERKEEIAKYLNDKIELMRKQIREYTKLKEHLMIVSHLVNTDSK